MAGFFGAVSKRDVTLDVYFGVDYHSHLGTKRAGMTVLDLETGFQRAIHSIETTPFRTKFEDDLNDFHGTSAIGCISDKDPQPLMVRSHLGVYAITTIGTINNHDEILKECFENNDQQFMVMSSGEVNQTELVAYLINKKADLVEGIKYVQDIVQGSMTLLVMTDDGSIIAARDKVGRLPILIGKDDDGHCVSFESFAYQKIGYETVYELGPGEIVLVTPETIKVLAEPGEEMKICSFLWCYYGYPNSNYEGVNVEQMRYRNGQIMARDEKEAGIQEFFQALSTIGQVQEALV
ncbi:MAG: amidophosphoribosyltransferase, partial [Anaerotardibacter sp.]